MASLLAVVTLIYPLQYRPAFVTMHWIGTIDPFKVFGRTRPPVLPSTDLVVGIGSAQPN